MLGTAIFLREFTPHEPAPHLQGLGRNSICKDRSSPTSRRSISIPNSPGFWFSQLEANVAASGPRAFGFENQDSGRISPLIGVRAGNHSHDLLVTRFASGQIRSVLFNARSTRYALTSCTGSPRPELATEIRSAVFRICSVRRAASTSRLSTLLKARLSESRHESSIRPHFQRT